MAADATKELSFYLQIPISELSPLGSVRNQKHLKMGAEDDFVWVKGFSEPEIRSTLIRSIPYARRFYEQNGRLYLIDSQLPERSIPAILWTPIERYLPLEVAKYNHNFFGLDDKVELTLVPSDREQEAEALLVSAKVLAQYVETAAEFRMKPIKWLVLGKAEALLIGKPLLPLPGKTYWKREKLFLPTGYELNHPMLHAALASKLNLRANDLLLWHTDAGLNVLKASYFKKLSISSVRLTMSNNSQNDEHVF